MIDVSSDLTRASTINIVFKQNIASRDLFSYAIKDADQYFIIITTAQRQHGDIVARSSLLPEAAADVYAKTFFEFVLVQPA